MAQAECCLRLAYPQIRHPLCGAGNNASQETQGRQGRHGRYSDHNAGNLTREQSALHSGSGYTDGCLCFRRAASQCSGRSLEGASCPGGAHSRERFSPPVEALDTWLELAAIDKGSVFRAIDRWGNVANCALDPKAINDIVVKTHIRGLFTQKRVAASANLFLDGLLGDERRKTGWMRAEAAGDSGPWKQQAILGRGRWDADELRGIVREYVVEHLATDDAVLVIEETGFLKQGKASCGVSRQYTGSAGKITNCQIGVFAAYVSVRVHAFIDRALYLPKSWTGDPARLAAAHAPEAVAFATKPGLAVDMIRRALAADVPFSWVAADAVYGVGNVEGTLRRACKGYVLGVKSDHHFGSWLGKPPVAGTAQEIARDLDPGAWQRLCAGEGTKGARLHDWAYCELADLDADEYNETKSGLWTPNLCTRGLLIRRNISCQSAPNIHPFYLSNFDPL